MNESTSARELFPLQSSPPNMMQHALHLATQNFPLLPIHSTPLGKCTCARPNCDSAGKHPITKHGYKDATNDKAAIEKIWKTYSLANIGIATGSISGIVVVDVDVKNDGLESIAKLQKTYGSLDHHRQVRSGGGGLHFYFKNPNSVTLKSRVNLVSGIDLRAEGGYIIAPPSLHITGCHYEWLNQNEIQEMPSWLLALASAESTVPMFTTNARGEKDTKKQVEIGSRKNTLMSISGFLRHKGLNRNQMHMVLKATNIAICNPPMPEAEVDDVVKSASKYNDWLEIIPFQCKSCAAKPLTKDMLPTLLLEWVCDICERMQLPLEFIAAPAIVAVASIIGRKAGIKPLQHDNWTVTPNLWGMLIADPGSMKSAALAQAFKPLTDLENKARREFEKVCHEESIRQKDIALQIEAMKQSLKLDWSQGLGKKIDQKKEEISALTQQLEGNRTKEKRHKTNDPTIEKLSLLLKDNPQGLLLLRDELSGWLESLARNGREGSREFFLEAWNGDGSFSFDRVGRGSVFTESICLSIFGGIQPDRLKRYIERFDQSHGQDGFLERFQLTVYPDRIKKWSFVDKQPDERAYARVNAFFERIDAIDFDGQQRIASFDKEAQIIANEWRVRLENRINSDGLANEKRSFLGKYRSLMPSLALIFQCLEDGGLSEVVGCKALQLAVEWTDLLESHMDKIFNSASATERGATLLLEKIQEGVIKDGCTLRDIYRKAWSGLRTAQDVEPCLALLRDKGYIDLRQRSNGARTYEVIVINPAFYERS